MRSQKFLRDELRFLTEFNTLFEVIQQAAVAQLRRADEQLTRQPRLAEVLQRDYFPLLPPAAKAEFLVHGGTAGRLLVVLTSDEGLAGPLHAGTVRQAMEYADSATHWILVGQRGLRFLGPQTGRLRVMPMPADEDAEPQVQRLANAIMVTFTREQLRDAWLIAPHFLSAARQTVVAQQLLPLPAPFDFTQDAARQDLVIEPSVTRVVEALAALWVEVLCIESWWSARRAEFAARALHMESSRQELAKHRKQLRYEFFKQVHGRVDVMVRETCVVQRLSAVRASQRTASGRP
ncbi:MAG: F0F1 ATP synthase subunit gamma [Candidatus Omnitrophota bacterium]|nr:F0F1 ATP synthase subunit gamma [Candidatus Omnitrophota bacterium]